MDDDAPTTAAVVIEDDAVVRDLLIDIFQSAGLRAIGAASGAEGIDAVAEHEPMITTVDINMPGIDGLETTRRIRDRSATHIIVVSALTDEADAVLALSSGADDFVAKPFRAREFRARIDAVLRRAKSGQTGREVPAEQAALRRTDDTFVHEDLTVDPATRIAERGGIDLGLTRTEFDLLVALLETGRRVRTKDDLVRVSRGERPGSNSPVTEVEMRTIETHIAKLRRKLDEDLSAPRYIETVRGVGYRLTPGGPSGQPT
jgi:two-component system OmpR family response regulator